MDTLAFAYLIMCAVAYVVLSCISLYCAISSGRLVEEAIGRRPRKEAGGALRGIVVLLAACWLVGIIILMSRGGTHAAIAKGAEGFLKDGLSGEERKWVRIAVREYRRRHKLI